MKELVNSLMDHVGSNDFKNNPVESGLLSAEQKKKIGQENWREIGAIKYVGNKLEFYLLAGKLTQALTAARDKELRRWEKIKRFLFRTKRKYGWFDGIVVMGTVNGEDIFSLVFTKRP